MAFFFFQFFLKQLTDLKSEIKFIPLSLSTPPSNQFREILDLLKEAMTRHKTSGAWG